MDVDDEMKPMTKLSWIAWLVLSATSACNYDVGPCWLADHDEAPPIDCDVQGTCATACLDGYADAADDCGAIEEGAQRAACYEQAHTVHEGCRADCRKAQAKCEDACRAAHGEDCDAGGGDEARAACHESVSRLVTCIDACKNE